MCGDQRDGLRQIREGRSDGFSKIREDGDDGFVQKPNRKTRKRLEKTDEMTSANWSNKFDVLKLTDSELEEEVNAVNVVQEIVWITVDSGAAKSVWPIRKTTPTQPRRSRRERVWERPDTQNSNTCG